MRVVIVGGGLVGCLLAAQLDDVVVLEKQLPTFDTTPSGRPISLSATSQQALVKLGLWSTLSQFATPIQAVHTSVKGRFGRSLMKREKPFGFVVPYTYLYRTLYEYVADKVRCVNSIDAIDGGVVSFTAAGKMQTLEADLVVGADGTHSRVAELMQIDYDVKAEGLIALAGRLTLAGKHNCTGYERFNAPGTLAVLPMYEPHCCGVVWSLPKALATEFAQLDDESVCEKIQQAFGFRLGKFEQFDRTGQFPLQIKLACEQAKAATVLIGNAAHTLYPLAAQGFNLGLRDAMTLAQLIHSRLSTDDIVRQYPEKRAHDQQQVVQLVGMMARFLTGVSPTPNALKALSLLMVDVMPCIKQTIVQRALGGIGYV